MGGSGGGSSGGGSSSPPAYLQKFHEDWIGRQVDGEPTQEVNTTMVEAINAAHDANPFDEMTLPSSVGIFDLMDAAVVDYGVKVDELFLTPGIDRILESTIAAAQKQIDRLALPRFEAGMRNIGAVNTSAFVVGRALIMSDVAIGAGQTAASVLQNAFNQQWDAAQRLLHYRLESLRMRMVTSVELAEKANALKEHGARWPLEVYQYGSNLLASVSGGTAPVVSQQRSSGLSTIGGALQGASLGAQLGGSIGGQDSNWGGIGAVIGGIAGIFA